MGIFSRKRRNNAYANATDRITRNLSSSSGWLTDLINGSLARSYDEYESGAGISAADAFQAQYNYKTMLEQMEFNRFMQEDAQAFNAEMQANSQAFNSAEAEKQRFWEEQPYYQQQQECSIENFHPHLSFVVHMARMKHYSLKEMQP